MNAIGFYDDDVVRTDRRMAHRPASLHTGAGDRAGGGVVSFAEKYGPWAVVAGASDGVGAAFAEALAERGVNVVLLARRQAVLDKVAAGIGTRTGVQTRTLAVDLAQPGPATAIAEATADLDVGFLVYCAGADPDFEPFLANPVSTAEAMIQRNCTVPVQLCHHFAPAMVERGSGGIVVFGSGAGFAGAPNMVAYAATKAFDMVFAEALWSELHDKGVDVLGLILGKTDTPGPAAAGSRTRLDGRCRPAAGRCRHGRRGGHRGLRQSRQRTDVDRRREHARGHAGDGLAEPQRTREPHDRGQCRFDGADLNLLRALRDDVSHGR